VIILAALPAITPLMLSSKTRQEFGSSLAWFRSLIDSFGYARGSFVRAIGVHQRRPRFARFTLRSATVTQRVSPSHSSAQTRPGRHCATVPTGGRPRFFRFRLRSDTLTQLVSPSHRSAQTRPEGHAAALTAGVMAPIGSENEIAIRAKNVWWMRMIFPSCTPWCWASRSFGHYPRLFRPWGTRRRSFCRLPIIRLNL
jgi:hypothetical protein